MTGGPLLRVDRGEPDPEELAAVAVAVLALLTRPAAAPRTSTPTWSLRPHPVPGAWNQHVPKEERPS